MRFIVFFVGLLAAAGPAAAVGYNGQVGTNHGVSLPGSGNDCNAAPGCAGFGAGVGPGAGVDDSLQSANVCVFGANNGGGPGGAGGGAGYSGGGGEDTAHASAGEGGCVNANLQDQQVDGNLNGGQDYALQPAGVQPSGQGNWVQFTADPAEDNGLPHAHFDGHIDFLNTPMGGNSVDWRLHNDLGDGGPPFHGCVAAFSSLPPQPQGPTNVNAAVNDDCQPPPTDCQDGLDNDGDGAADFPSDGGCNAPWDQTELPDCSDGLDNDGDGQADAGDAQCSGPGDGSEQPACQDGADNDGDGWFDGADPQRQGPDDDDEAS